MCNPADHIAGFVQILDFSFCEFEIRPPRSVIIVMGVVQITLGTLMCLLVIVRFIKESLQMYNVTRRFELNCYMNLLTRQGVFYFLAYVPSCPLAISSFMLT